MKRKETREQGNAPKLLLQGKAREVVGTRNRQHGLVDVVLALEVVVVVVW